MDDKMSKLQNAARVLVTRAMQTVMQIILMILVLNHIDATRIMWLVLCITILLKVLCALFGEWLIQQINEDKAEAKQKAIIDKGFNDILDVLGHSHR